LRKIKKSLDIIIPQDLCHDFKKCIILHDNIAKEKILFWSQSNCGTTTSLRISHKNHHHGCSVNAEKSKCDKENKDKNKELSFMR
jgi:hypothetical protein